MEDNQRQSNKQTAQSFIDTAAALATLNANTSNMQRDMSDIKDDIKQLKGQYVTRDEFTLVRTMVFGMFGTILIYLLNIVLGFFQIHH